MKFLIRYIELCALFGANCASLITTYQPNLPDSLK